MAITVATCWVCGLPVPRQEGVCIEGVRGEELWLHWECILDHALEVIECARDRLAFVEGRRLEGLTDTEPFTLLDDWWQAAET